MSNNVIVAAMLDAAGRGDKVTLAGLVELSREQSEAEHEFDGFGDEGESESSRRVNERMLEFVRGKMSGSSPLAEPVRLSEADANPWSEYQGKRGGKGWRNSATGAIRYGGERPGAHESGSDEDDQKDSHSPDETTHKEEVEDFLAGSARDNLELIGNGDVGRAINFFTSDLASHLREGSINTEVTAKIVERFMLAARDAVDNHWTGLVAEAEKRWQEQYSDVMSEEEIEEVLQRYSHFLGEDAMELHGKIEYVEGLFDQLSDKDPDDVSAEECDEIENEGLDVHAFYDYYMKGTGYRESDFNYEIEHTAQDRRDERDSEEESEEEEDPEYIDDVQYESIVDAIDTLNSDMYDEDEEGLAYDIGIYNERLKENGSEFQLALGDDGRTVSAFRADDVPATKPKDGPLVQRGLFEAKVIRKEGEEWETSGRWYKRTGGKTVRISKKTDQQKTSRPAAKSASVPDNVKSAITDYLNRGGTDTATVAGHIGSLNINQMRQLAKDLGLASKGTQKAKLAKSLADEALSKVQLKPKDKQAAKQEPKSDKSQEQQKKELPLHHLEYPEVKSLSDEELDSHIAQIDKHVNDLYTKAKESGLPEDKDAFFAAYEKRQLAYDEQKAREGSAKKRTTQKKPDLQQKAIDARADELQREHTLSGLMGRLSPDERYKISTNTGLPTEEKAKLAAMKKLAAKAVASKEQPTAKPAPKQKAIFSSANTEHRDQTIARAAVQLQDANRRTGGIIKVPDLVDKVKETYPDATPEEIHQYLQQMQRDDKLTLQLVNDPRLEPRADEMIRTPTGLRGYVYLRPKTTELGKQEQPTTKPTPKQKPSVDDVHARSVVGGKSAPRAKREPKKETPITPKAQESANKLQAIKDDLVQRYGKHKKPGPELQQEIESQFANLSVDEAKQVVKAMGYQVVPKSKKDAMRMISLKIHQHIGLYQRAFV